MDEHNLPKRPWEDYEEYARKMDQFVYGPTTTYFEQLIAAGISLPEPTTIDDDDVRKKLWEVIAGLAQLRVFVHYTNHLNDRELYATLWNNHLHGETPALDEIGFTSGIDVVTAVDEDDGALFFRHYADERFRESWRTDWPDFVMPAHEDPPYNRDSILPRPTYDRPPEAREWLRANPNETAFALRRFGSTTAALSFVEQVYAAGATGVTIDKITCPPSHGWLPYGEELTVTLPPDVATRRAIFDVIDAVGLPDEDPANAPPDDGSPMVQVSWN